LYLQNYKDEAQKQRKIIYQLEKERDRYINEASELTQKVLQHMEDVKVREMQIFDYKKKIAEAETKLKQQQVCLLSSKLLLKELVRFLESNSKLHVASSFGFNSCVYR